MKVIDVFEGIVAKAGRESVKAALRRATERVRDSLNEFRYYDDDNVTQPEAVLLAGAVRAVLLERVDDNTFFGTVAIELFVRDLRRTYY